MKCKDCKNFEDWNPETTSKGSCIISRSLVYGTDDCPPNLATMIADFKAAKTRIAQLEAENKKPHEWPGESITGVHPRLKELMKEKEREK